MKIRADLVIENAAELLTLRGDRSPRVKQEMPNLCIVQNGAIAVGNGRIIAVGKFSELKEQVELDRKTEIIDATSKLVMPGFVDCHTHTIFAGSRENELALKLQGKSYIEILKEGGGILSTVRATRKANVEELVASAEKRLHTMLCYGTTTVEIKTGYGLNEKDELKCLETIKILKRKHVVDIVPTFLGAHALPPEYENNADGYVDFLIKKVLPKVAAKKLAKYCDVFCEKGMFSIAQSKRILKAAKNLGFGLKIHADEINQTGGAELAAELKAISAAHLLMSSQKGIKAMAREKVIGVLLPGTPFSLMQERYADARKMIDLGLPIALATDLSPNCWTESMQFVIALACYKMRMMPEEAITASTLNAAHAIGMSSEVGSLEPGKKADILILDVPNYKHVSYHFGVNLVDIVIKNGVLVVENGKLIT